MAGHYIDPCDPRDVFAKAVTEIRSKKSFASAAPLCHVEKLSAIRMQAEDNRSWGTAGRSYDDWERERMPLRTRISAAGSSLSEDDEPAAEAEEEEQGSGAGPTHINRRAFSGKLVAYSGGALAPTPLAPEPPMNLPSPQGPGPRAARLGVAIAATRTPRFGAVSCPDHEYTAGSSPPASSIYSLAAPSSSALPGSPPSASASASAVSPVSSAASPGGAAAGANASPWTAAATPASAWAGASASPRGPQRAPSRLGLYVGITANPGEGSPSGTFYRSHTGSGSVPAAVGIARAPSAAASGDAGFVEDAPVPVLRMRSVTGPVPGPALGLARPSLTRGATPAGGSPAGLSPGSPVPGNGSMSGAANGNGATRAMLQPGVTTGGGRLRRSVDMPGKNPWGPPGGAAADGYMPAVLHARASETSGYPNLRSPGPTGSGDDIGTGSFALTGGSSSGCGGYQRRASGVSGSPGLASPVSSASQVNTLFVTGTGDLYCALTHFEDANTHSSPQVPDFPTAAPPVRSGSSTCVVGGGAGADGLVPSLGGLGSRLARALSRSRSPSLRGRSMTSLSAAPPEGRAPTAYTADTTSRASTPSAAARPDSSGSQSFLNPDPAAFPLRPGSSAANSRPASPMRGRSARASALVQALAATQSGLGAGVGAGSAAPSPAPSSGSRARSRGGGLPTLGAVASELAYPRSPVGPPSPVRSSGGGSSNVIERLKGLLR
ncbi:hypothetical protein HYH03_016972 [Edaphochlamys debaryana]|uniref:Uncharacterized protein n=1 Tax=Edaphochlamys debaryana TaxID=47281 RepID=A0A835XJC6_9CHLO|nr:hypothetical protein HYH03_016972 [Edaphochlamys debaryana]|eukprot:KAG2484237.1 hypothetical protein HYH03_016972 [Edaphochlamys debaryana]